MWTRKTIIFSLLRFNKFKYWQICYLAALFIQLVHANIHIYLRLRISLRYYFLVQDNLQWIVRLTKSSSSIKNAYGAPKQFNVLSCLKRKFTTTKKACCYLKNKYKFFCFFFFFFFSNCVQSSFYVFSLFRFLPPLKK